MEVMESSEDEKRLEDCRRALNDPDSEARWAAIDSLRHVGHPSQTVHIFIASLCDSSWLVRALAAHALYDVIHDGELGALLDHAVEPLAMALRDEATEVGLNAAYALELLGPRASAVLPRLREVANASADPLRQAVIDAIRSIGGGWPG
jgi:HEAT repeat protein